MDQKILNMDTLVRLTSEAAVENARKSMDVVSVSSFKLDMRGRLEGAVKPAPPSTEPSSYVKITRRGSRYRADCNKHGRDTWCLHALILALHHLGAQPIFRQKQERPVAQPVAMGFQWVASFEEGRLRLRIRGKSGAGFINNPARFMVREYTALELTSRQATTLSELCEEDSEALDFCREDSAEALAILGKAALVNPRGESFVHKPWRDTLPKIVVSVKGETISWQAEGQLPDAIFLPGWPGFLVSGLDIFRVSGYVPDLYRLLGDDASLPLTWENLLPLLQEKHMVRWATPKPVLIDQLDNVGLDLQPRGRDLEGRLGIWHGDTFFPLNNVEDPNQVLKGRSRPALLKTNAYSMSYLQRDINSARLPMGTNGVMQIREQQAPSFLENTRLPQAWRVRRDAADHHFGQNRVTVETLWLKEGLLPRYKLGDEIFDHDTLAQNLREEGVGARLPDGRILNFDVREVARNRHIISGIAALHEDEAAQSNLLERVMGRKQGELGPEPEEPWRGLLRPYQLEGARWMAGNLSRKEPALLADDMGLGKTIQTLALLDMQKGEHPQLVVVPTSLIANWQEEAQRFCSHREVTLHHGARRARTVEELAGADLVITSYGTLLRDIDLLYDICFDIVVLDEAQAIKNAASQTSKAVCDLWCNHRIALTGTPVENRMTELWSIFRFLAPDYLGAEEEAKLVTMPGTPAYEALKAKTMPFLLRRKKEEVAKELPEKQIITVMLPMEKAQEEVYRHYQKQSVQELRTDGKKSTLSILTRLLRLRQACCHPGLLDEARAMGSSNKLTYLTEQLQEVQDGGHAALVFSQFTRLLHLVKFALEEADIPYLYLDGKTRNRQDLVHRFQDGEASVFLISLKAGGVGLNLTRASYVYHLDPWWNPAVEAQATDRAHRIGQKKKVLSYKLISQGTVEERILKLQSGKQFLSEGLWQDPEKLIASMDHDTLLGLLG